MIRQLVGLAVSGTFASSMVLTNSSCTSPQLAEADLEAQAIPGQPSGRQRLVQFEFGRNAAFGVCVEPACPVLTTKTLSASTAASAHPVMHRPVPSIPVQSSAASELGAPDALSALPATSTMPASTAATISGKTTRGIVIAFLFGSANLTDAAKATLSASTRQARQSERIVISGRTDGVGDDEVNERLALARALSVRDYLREQNPALAADISIDAKGRCCFVAPNETQDGRSKNRRVEVVFFSRADAAWRPESIPQRASVGLDSARETP